MASRQNIARNLPSSSRRGRRPSHTFQLRHRPWVIQPFLLAPVLPGETMRNLLMQVRAVTDPIKNPLIGWWLEHYFFYVKHRDMEARAEFENMMLDPAWTMDNVDQPAATTGTYCYGGTIDWTVHCLIRVRDEFFRVPGEAQPGSIDGMPIASVNVQNWSDSLVSDANMILPDVNVEGADANTTIQASEIEAAMRQYEFLRHNQLTNMTYEEYLGTYGVRPRPEESHVPELIRFSREWQYPSNTIDPSNGTPRSAVSWSLAERADKDRFFREPGFIFGVTVARPKVYFSKQLGSAAGMMNNALSWLPAVLNDDPYSSYKKFTDAALSGPLGAHASGDYWVDLKDLLLYGDQFINFSLAETNAGLVALPGADLNRRYVSDADIDGLFVTPNTGVAEYVRQDGVVTLQIAGSLKDTSETT